jgi:putative aminopeptidase FrvX
MARSPLQYLRVYCEACGAAGDETDFRERIVKDIQGAVDELSVSPLGNLVAEKRGSAKVRSLLITAHMDEVALIVRSLEKNGTIRFYPVGGVVPKILPATSVHIGKNRVPGVIASKAVHLLQPAEREKVPDVKELFIDVGASAREDVKNVTAGDYIYFRSPFTSQGACFFGKAFDDRAGCAALTFLLNRFRETRPKLTLAAVYTAQEEAGLRGAWTAAFGRQNVVFNLNLEATTCADRETKNLYSPSTEMGKGPAVTVMDRTMITHRKLFEWVLERAEAHGIPVQLKRTVTGGTDAGRIHLTETGIPSVTVAVPVRYIHAPWGVLSRRDFDLYLRLAGVLVDEAGLFTP